MIGQALGVMLATGLLAAAAPAGVVTARWGVAGRVQHANTLVYQRQGDEGTLMRFDLSALPAGAKVHRARLLLSGVQWKERGFDIVPAVRAGGKLRPAGKRLEPASPWYQWLDATEAVRAWAKAPARTGLLWMRSGRAFSRDATVLEIAYEGKLPARLPRQVRGVEAICRGGQVFVTFREIDPLDGGEAAIHWGDLVKKLKGDYYGPLPGGGQEDARYRVYCHDRPITAANVGQARLLGEALPGSAFNTRMGVKTYPGRKTDSMVAILAGRRGEAMGRGPGVGVLRVAVEPGKPVAPGTGVFVHTVREEGSRYYAVLTSVNGLANTRDISPANVAGPLRQRSGAPEPVLYKEIVTFARGARYVEQWYSFWTVQPLSPWPARYDVVVGCCPEGLEKPAAVFIHRNGWNSWPTPPRAQPTAAIHISHTGDQPVDFRTGLHDSIRTIKGFDQGKWQPFHSNRQVALIRWMSARRPVDAGRVSVHMGAWGMMEIKSGDLYAMIRGWGEPELTKGFQCWDRARGIWGAPDLYEGRRDDENPYVAANLTDWVLANPTRELPFVYLCAGGGAHYTEEGWPPFPRFCWAMMKSKQPFLFCTARHSAVAEAIQAGRLVLRRGRSLPAFANCSLDDNIGEGDLRSGEGWNNSQVNGWILWDSDTVVDEPGRWEVTVWVGERCPLPAGTVDLTPRRCRKFAAKPNQRFQWTNAVLPTSSEGARAGQRGTAVGDEHGFVTIRGLRVAKDKRRIAITPAR